MRSAKGLYNAHSNSAGITLTEIVVVVGILLVIFGLGGVTSFNLFRRVSLDGELDSGASVLRKARSEAISNINQSDFGVYIDAANFTVFEGSSYASRDPLSDENFPRSGGVDISGPSEIVFIALRGSSSASGTLALTSGAQSRSIHVNYEGRIDW